MTPATSTPAAGRRHRKWYRDWAISMLVVEALRGLGLAWPPAAFDVEVERRRLLAMP
jgi:hypothetical protein